MGCKQGLEILGQVAKKFKFAKNFLPPLHFVFYGDGVGREALFNLCKGLDFVHFFDLQPAESLNAFLAMADIHLLPQRADAADLVMPSKLSGILASRRPVLACARIRTELANVAKIGGLVVPPENPESFYNALLNLISDKNLRDKLGMAGLQYNMNNLECDYALSPFKLN